MDITKFEPGCIQCSECGWKPDDEWDTDPEGFKEIGKEWFCDECAEKFEVSEK